MSELLFEEPPARADRHKHHEAADELRKRPGEWAVVATYHAMATAHSVAQAIKKARLGAYAPAGAFEAKARTVDGQRRVYARFVGATADDGVGGE